MLENKFALKLIFILAAPEHCLQFHVRCWFSARCHRGESCRLTEVSVFFSTSDNVCVWHRGSKPVICCFSCFYSIILYTGYASKYFLQNKTIFFL